MIYKLLLNVGYIENYFFSFYFVLNCKFSKLTNKEPMLILGPLNKLFAKKETIFSLRLDMKIPAFFRIYILPLHYR